MSGNHELNVPWIITDRLADVVNPRFNSLIEVPQFLTERSQQIE